VPENETLEQARAAFADREWRHAHACYSQARRDSSLEPADLERFAIAAHLFGRESESREIFASGYRFCIERQDAAGATQFAFWVAHGMLFHGDSAQFNAWLGRAHAALEGCPEGCIESGYIEMLDGLAEISTGQFSVAEERFRRVRDTGRGFRDPTLAAMGGHGLGRSLIALGRVREGMDALDEAMVATTGGEASAIIVGDLYCGLLEACHDVFDVRRAREWTSALGRWCESQPELVTFRGPCFIHRVALMRLSGDWADAIEEAERAREWFARETTQEGPGDACYELGELLRLKGQFSEAEEAYLQASRHGRSVEPGMQLLWLARGQPEAAERALSRALADPGMGAARRADLLSAFVEVLLARGEIGSARAAADNLALISGEFEAPLVAAMADGADGRVLLAQGAHGLALAPLRRSWSAWQQLNAPFEAARVRACIGMAYRELGDTESAAMEFDAARWVFEQLGASPELERLSPAGQTDVATGSVVTPRELEVLRLVALGQTNREIAAALVISEHTVARHIQNMLGRLGFSSRARLAAFGAEKGLVPPAGQN
jgi:DNA-binding CsgD family transcriptional regulator